MNKPLQGMAPTLMPSNIWHAGRISRMDRHTDGQMHASSRAPVRAKNPNSLLVLSALTLDYGLRLDNFQNLNKEIYESILQKEK